LDEPWGWPEHVRKISPPPGLEPPTAQPIVCCYTSYATAASTIMGSSQKKKRPEWVNIYESMAASNEFVKPTQLLHLAVLTTKCVRIHNIHETNTKSFH
jgi:hypothetical protein